MRAYHILIILLFITCQFVRAQGENGREYEIINGTFLGNETRSWYGSEAPAKLDVIWRTPLGKGETYIGKEKAVWAGSGWTGQPLMVKENGDSLFIIQGAYDHNLKKINAENGKIVWEYPFQDVIKGTGTLWENKKADNPDNRLVILQGSRRGIDKTTASAVVPSYRAISYYTGKELWRMNIRKTRSYSRDTDGSAIIVSDTAYLAMENSTFISFDPSVTSPRDGYNWTTPIEEHILYKDSDVRLHGGNLVAESSPARMGNRLYFTSGSGYVFGYNMDTRKLDWEFPIGSDMDGSAVITDDNCVLVSVEKQYIEGQGGVFKLNPALPPEESVMWYYPVEDKNFASWKGGIIGSPAVNDKTRPEGFPALAAFVAIDGYLYVVDYKTYDTTFAAGPNNKNVYNTPKLVFKTKTGPSICTPLFAGNRLVVAGYWGIRVFEMDKDMNFTQLAHRGNSSFESTPFIHKGWIYVGSRDGYFYCLGEK